MSKKQTEEPDVLDKERLKNKMPTLAEEVKSKTVDIAAVVVAACALIVSVQQGCQTRQHNQLSVMPRVIVSFWSNDSGAGWTFQNSGLGPADIRDFRVTVDGKLQHSWDEVIKALNFERTKGTMKMGFMMVYPGYSLQRPTETSSEVGNLFWIYASPHAALLLKNIERVQITVTYCSIYKDCWKTVSNSVEPPQEVPYPETPEVTFHTPPSWGTQSTFR